MMDAERRRWLELQPYPLLFLLPLMVGLFVVSGCGGHYVPDLVLIPMSPCAWSVSAPPVLSRAAIFRPARILGL
jgi:hypothetical protein